MKSVRKEVTAFTGPVGERADCSVRALSVAARISYSDAHARFAAAGRKNGCRTPWKAIDTVHGAMGLRDIFAWKSPTLAQFLKVHPRGRFVLIRRGHSFALVDGIVHDWARGTGARSRIIRAWEVTV
jgi:hypothetical protein